SADPDRLGKNAARVFPGIHRVHAHNGRALDKAERAFILLRAGHPGHHGAAHRLPGGLQPGMAPGNPGRLPAAGSAVRRPVAPGPHPRGPACGRGMERVSEGKEIRHLQDPRSTHDRHDGKGDFGTAQMNGELRTPQDVFSWAESFTNLERGSYPPDKRVYRLDRMHRLLEMFDDPQARLRIIHVAGTKGKGSTSALLASVLHAAGIRTGLYTSPHVESYFERIAIAGEPREPELLVRVGGEVKAVIDRLPPKEFPGHYGPTTFELLTLLAFLYFRESGCTEAVVETGIGGRLDATNVVRSEASVITPLDLEHTEILGDTLEKIAMEKAGIIKPGAPCFVALQPPQVKEVIRQVCRERGSAPAFLDEETSVLTAAGRRTGRKIPAFHARRVPGGKCRARLSPPEADPAGDHNGAMPAGLSGHDPPRAHGAARGGPRRRPGRRPHASCRHPVEGRFPRGLSGRGNPPLRLGLRKESARNGGDHGPRLLPYHHFHAGDLQGEQSEASGGYIQGRESGDPAGSGPAAGASTGPGA